MHRARAFLAFISILLTPLFSAKGQAPVLSREIEPSILLEKHLKTRFDRLTVARAARFEEIKGRAGREKWQAERRRFFLKQIGAFPERTPLNAKIVGKLKGDGYRIEKIIFESRPDFHVTASLYLPDSPAPYPAVLLPCGHSHNGKVSGQYQKAAILLAKNGMATLCYDPVGQGERYQVLAGKDNLYFHDHPRRIKVPHSRIQHLCTSEHTLMAVGSILLGENFAQYRIWDGMRAIDYLQSRPDIIPEKIGCTGNSGGGTLTSYLMALEDRIVAASPGSYLTTFSKLIETKGPQDGEQNIFGQIAFGMDASDYVTMRAPSPVLICAGTRDATFDISGTREVFTEANRFYSLQGYPERVAIHEAAGPHGFLVQHREAVARFMHRWLLGSEKVIWELPRSEWPDPVTDVFLHSLNEPVRTQEELYATPEGQVGLLSEERTVFEINAEKLTAIRKIRELNWRRKTPAEKQETIREVIGETENTGIRFETTSTEKGDDFSILQIILHRDGKIPLPALVYQPARETGKRILYLDGASKTATGEPERLAREGNLVIAPDITGIGETEAGSDRRSWGYGRFGWDNQEILTAYLMGDSFVRMRVSDIEAFSRYFKGESCEVIAIGQAAIPALHAAALNRETIAVVTVKQMISSWAEVVSAGEHWNQLVNAVHGALKHYDLPDLVELTNARVLQPVGVNWKGKAENR